METHDAHVVKDERKALSRVEMAFFVASRCRQLARARDEDLWDFSVSARHGRAEWGARARSCH